MPVSKKRKKKKSISHKKDRLYFCGSCHQYRCRQESKRTIKEMVQDPNCKPIRSICNGCRGQA